MIAWHEPRHGWRLALSGAVGCFLMFAGLMLFGVQPAVAGLVAVVVTSSAVWWIHSEPSRERKRLVAEHKACAHCWGIFEPGDKGYKYDGQLICEQSAKELGVLDEAAKQAN